MKVLILSNQARSMAIFWRVLIGKMRDGNMEVVCCAPAGDAESDAALESMGARVVHYPLDRKGLNPIRDLESLVSLKRIFSTEKPDILFSTTIKPVIYGCMAAHWAKIPGIFPTITGLGFVFETDSLFKKAVNRLGRAMYRESLKYANGIFFQNRDDADLFNECGILSPSARVLFAAGTGVDTKYFAPEPFPAFPPEGGIIFLLVARLLEAKGLEEYAEAAANLKKKYPDARFQLLGPPEKGLGSLSMKRIEDWNAAGTVEYLGETRDVRPFLAACHVAVLPSWREGTPTSLMEAMSMGRPCVATDVPGCREVVRNGQNGWLVRAKDPASLAEGMEKFLLEPRSVVSMGNESRKLALEKFDAEKVAGRILDDMLEIYSARQK